MGIEPQPSHRILIGDKSASISVKLKKHHIFTHVLLAAHIISSSRIIAHDYFVFQKIIDTPHTRHTKTTT